jgi:hypothetical protein
LYGKHCGDSVRGAVYFAVYYLSAGWEHLVSAWQRTHYRDRPARPSENKKENGRQRRLSAVSSHLPAKEIRGYLTTPAMIMGAAAVVSTATATVSMTAAVVAPAIGTPAATAAAELVSAATTAVPTATVADAAAAVAAEAVSIAEPMGVTAEPVLATEAAIVASESVTTAESVSVAEPAVAVEALESAPVPVATAPIVRPVERRMGVVEAIPGAGADEHTAGEPLRTPVTIGCAVKRIIRIIPVRADRRRVVKAVIRTYPDTDGNLRLGVSGGKR